MMNSKNNEKPHNSIIRSLALSELGAYLGAGKEYIRQRIIVLRGIKTKKFATVKIFCK